MRRILVPLDGSHLAERILPDARRVAGPDGELVLIRDVNWIRYNPATGRYSLQIAAEEADRYLEELAMRLWQEGVKVTLHRPAEVDAAWAIDIAALEFEVDMVACATHGRRPLGRLFSGGVAWKALANSPVPVLLRHFVGPEITESGQEQAQRRILVPLDGSAFAETAVPLAAELAREWKAALWLTQVVSDYLIPDTAFRRSDLIPSSLSDELAATRAYLGQQAEGLPEGTHTEVLLGPPVVEALIEAVRDRAITDIVMASHGRTGLERVILGSVADELIHRLSCPIVVVPALAARRLNAAQEAHEEEMPVLLR